MRDGVMLQVPQVAAIERCSRVGRMARTASKTESQLGIILRGGDPVKSWPIGTYLIPNHMYFSRGI